MKRAWNDGLMLAGDSRAGAAGISEAGSSDPIRNGRHHCETPLTCHQP